MSPQGSEEPRLPLPQIVVSLVGAGLATAILYLSGLSYWDAHYSRLGIPANEIVLNPFAYLMKGFTEVLPLASLVAFVAILMTFVVLRETRADLKTEHHLRVLLAYASIAGLLSYATSLIQLNQDPLRVAGFNLPFSFSQVIVLLAVGIVATVILVAQTTTLGRPIRLLLGQTFTGQTILAIILAVTLILSASVNGSREASDKLWHEKPHQEVSFMTSNGTMSPNYFFIAHHAGHFYVLNTSELENARKGTTTSILLIPDNEIRYAIIRLLP